MLGCAEMVQMTAWPSVVLMYVQYIKRNNNNMEWLTIIGWCFIVSSWSQCECSVHLSRHKYLLYSQAIPWGTNSFFSNFSHLLFLLQNKLLGSISTDHSLPTLPFHGTLFHYSILKRGAPQFQCHFLGELDVFVPGLVGRISSCHSHGSVQSLKKLISQGILSFRSI